MGGKNKIVEKNKMPENKMPEQNNLYFIFAIAAILLGGDLVWWQTQQLGEDYDEQTAAIVASFSRPRGLSDTEKAERDLQVFEDSLNKEAADLESSFTDPIVQE